MKQLIAVAVVFSLTLPAWPEEAAPPPPDGEVQEPPRHEPQAEQMGYYESCFGVPHVGHGPFGVSGEVVVPISGGSTGGGSSVSVSSKSPTKKRC